jgi:hypothetical protein
VAQTIQAPLFRSSPWLVPALPRPRPRLQCSSSARHAWRIASSAMFGAEGFGCLQQQGESLANSYKGTLVSIMSPSEFQPCALGMFTLKAPVFISVSNTLPRATPPKGPGLPVLG